MDDPRGNTLGRGTRVTLHLKEDAHVYLSEDKLKEASNKYSQFLDAGSADSMSASSAFNTRMTPLENWLRTLFCLLVPPRWADLKP